MHSSRIVGIVVLFLSLSILTGCPNEETTQPNNNDPKPSGIIYMNAKQGTTIYSINLASGQVTNLFAGTDPHRTPEGTFILKTNRGLEEVSADGNTSRVIVQTKVAPPYDETYNDDFHNPQLSPDGKYIAYEGQYGFVYDVYIVDRTTGELLATFDSETSGEGFVRPTWTPDGRLVMGGSQYTPGLYITDANWTTVTRFDPNFSNPRHPIVSPDGSKVAFVMNDHIYVSNIDGTGLTQITSSSDKESWPTWSPDGEWLASYSTTSVLFYPLSTEGFYNMRDISSEVYDYVSYWAYLQGQFQWY